MLETNVIPFARPSTPSSVALSVPLKHRRLPRLFVMSSDLSQRVVRVAENQVEFAGRASSRAILSVTVDAHRLTVQIPSGATPETSAVLLAAKLPTGYLGFVDGGSITVVRDDDHFGMTA